MLLATLIRLLPSARPEVLGRGLPAPAAATAATAAAAAMDEGRLEGEGSCTSGPPPLLPCPLPGLLAGAGAPRPMGMGGRAEGSEARPAYKPPVVMWPMAEAAADMASVSLLATRSVGEMGPGGWGGGGCCCGGDPGRSTEYCRSLDIATMLDASLAMLLLLLLYPPLQSLLLLYRSTPTTDTAMPSASAATSSALRLGSTSLTRLQARDVMTICTAWRLYSDRGWGSREIDRVKRGQIQLCETVRQGCLQEPGMVTVP